MFHYLIRRLMIGSVTLLLITFVVYALIRHMPGTPLTTDPAVMDPSKQITGENLKMLERIYGLDKPWYMAYFQWLGNVFRGEFGRSFVEKRPVERVIGQRLGPTLLLSGTSLLLTYILSLPMGLYASARSGLWRERSLSTFLYMLYSIPSFVAALLLLSFFYVRLANTPIQLPLGGMHGEGYDDLSIPGKALDLFRHMLLPVFCLTYSSLAYFSRFVKSNMEEVLRQDFIRTARAKGVDDFHVVVHHAFRNTLIPFVTLIGLTLPSIVGGSVILEYIFTWPGIGWLFLESITRRDYPILMGLTLMFSVLTLLGQLLADVLYAVVDPRVTYT